VADPDDNEDRKRIRIQRRRLGTIMNFQVDKSYGFICAEDFRDDVYFHLFDWEGTVMQGGVSKELAPEESMWVEFELDEEHFENEKRLRAKVVRPTDRPVGKKLSGRDATFKIVTHHPNARKKRPTWREK
jgi:cold shock CspA family protein